MLDIGRILEHEKLILYLEFSRRKLCHVRWSWRILVYLYEYVYCYINELMK